MRTIIQDEVTEIKEQKIWSLGEVKNYLRVTGNEDDSLIASLLNVAIDGAELFTGMNLYQRRILYKIKNAPCILQLKYVPMMKILSIKQINKGSSYTDVKDSFGQVNVTGDNIYFNQNLVGRDLVMEYIAGYKNNIPRAIQHGILVHIAAMYDHEENSTGLSTKARDLYLPYRAIRV